MLKLTFILLITAYLSCGHNHGHDHGHDHGHGNFGEDPKFKYSKQANKNADDGPDFPSDQEHAHHDHHGHDHDDHDHHDHGHTHDNLGEDPKFKYSKHANTKEDSKTSHGHSHEAHDHSHEAHDHTTHETKSKPFSPPAKKSVVWWEPLLATAVISAAPFLILYVVPLNSNNPENQPFLKILLAFASGGLLGDAFLHLIPHAISPHAHDGSDSHSHGHSHAHDGDSHEGSHDHTGDMIVGMWVLGGIIAFLVVEKLVRHLKGGHGHSHGHSHAKTEDKKEQEADKKKGDKKEQEADKKKGDKKEQEADKKTGDKKKEKEIEKTESEPEIKVSAYLNLAADFTHNFTDGLAIGASFLVSRNVGLITTLTIFLHEIPHEIGDFAILVQSGCTKQKAMRLQLVTAVGAFAGCICGLLAEGLGTAAISWILPFTAGGFIYIATVSVIPELLEESSLMQSVKEIFSLLVGVFLMILIAISE